MLIYEVNITLRPSVDVAFYRAWLLEHMAEMLAQPGFLTGCLYAVETDEVGQGATVLCVHYEVASQQDLEHYLQVLAPAMRAEGTQRFTEGVEIQRRILANPLRQERVG